MVPPLSISSPPWPSGGMVSSIWRLATPESEKERIWAIVPRCRGALPSSIVNETRAWPSSPSSIFDTLPAGVPPIVTTSPPTSWEALENSAVTSYPPEELTKT